MCDPGWLFNRAETVDDSIFMLKQIARNNAPIAGEGGEARACPKLVQFRKFVNRGCISKARLADIEQAFAPFECDAAVYQ